MPHTLKVALLVACSWWTCCCYHYQKIKTEVSLWNYVGKCSALSIQHGTPLSASFSLITSLLALDVTISQLSDLCRLSLHHAVSFPSWYTASFLPLSQSITQTWSYPHFVFSDPVYLRWTSVATNKWIGINIHCCTTLNSNRKSCKTTTASDLFNPSQLGKLVSHKPSHSLTPLSIFIICIKLLLSLYTGVCLLLI